MRRRASFVIHHQPLSAAPVCEWPLVAPAGSRWRWLPAEPTCQRRSELSVLRPWPPGRGRRARPALVTSGQRLCGGASVDTRVAGAEGFLVDGHAEVRGRLARKGPGRSACLTATCPPPRSHWLLVSCILCVTPVIINKLPPRVYEPSCKLWNPRRESRAPMVGSAGESGLATGVRSGRSL